MPRVKRGTVRRAKRKKLLARAKGFYQTKSKLYRAAKESVDTAAKYAYVGRKNKKRDFRRLWVVRINAAARENGLTYSQLMRGLKAAGSHARPQDAGRPGRHAAGAFAKVAAQAKAALPAPGECLITLERSRRSRALRELRSDAQLAARRPIRRTALEGRSTTSSSAASPARSPA